MWTLKSSYKLLIEPIQNCLVASQHYKKIFPGSDLRGKRRRSRMIFYDVNSNKCCSWLLILKSKMIKTCCLGLRAKGAWTWAHSNKPHNWLICGLSTDRAWSGVNFMRQKLWGKLRLAEFLWALMGSFSPCFLTESMFPFMLRGTILSTLPHKIDPRSKFKKKA